MWQILDQPLITNIAKTQLIDLSEIYLILTTVGLLTTSCDNFINLLVHAENYFLAINKQDLSPEIPSAMVKKLAAQSTKTSFILLLLIGYVATPKLNRWF